MPAQPTSTTQEAMSAASTAEATDRPTEAVAIAVDDP
jgi:hypothetical protein